MKEIKLYIDDVSSIEEKLIQLGGVFSHELHVVDTYFTQPQGEVLKVVEDNSGNYVAHFKANQEGGFDILSKEKVNDAKETKQQLTEKFGMICALDKVRRFYTFKDFSVNINLIKDLGNFLIVEGEKVTKDTVEKVLGFQNPRYLTTSFDKLKMQKE